MPILFSYDLKIKPPSPDHNRIQSLFERFGWEHLGGSCFRYPPLTLGKDTPVEDWFNNVIPALMLFRAFVLKNGNRASTFQKFTLDVQSSSGYRKNGLGTPPVSGKKMKEDKKLVEPKNKQFGEQNLIDWLDSVISPY